MKRRTARRSGEIVRYNVRVYAENLDLSEWNPQLLAGDLRQGRLRALAHLHCAGINGQTAVLVEFDNGTGNGGRDRRFDHAGYSFATPQWTAGRDIRLRLPSNGLRNLIDAFLQPNATERLTRDKFVSLVVA